MKKYSFDIQKQKNSKNKLIKRSSLIEWIIAIILALILFALLGNIIDPNVPGCATNVSYTQDPSVFSDLGSPISDWTNLFIVLVVGFIVTLILFAEGTKRNIDVKN